VAIWQHERAEIIVNDHGCRTTPSWVAFTETGRLIGVAAKNQAVMNPSNTIFDVKRLIGRTMDDAIIQQDLKNLPFKVIGKDGNKLHIQGMDENMLWCCSLRL
jgi:L1 cell adhesion molecule like protein